MGTDASLSALLHLLHTSDSSFPTGAYAHSLGLEGLADLGVVTDAASLSAWMGAALLPQLAASELPWVFHAHAAAAAGDAARIAELDRECHAMRATRELREASSATGLQRLRLAQMLSPHPMLEDLLARAARGELRGSAPVLQGVIAACAGVAPAQAAAAYGYQSLSGAVAASVKLLRLGQNAAQRVLADALARLPDAVDSARAVAAEDIGWFAPLADVASARHETAEARLFIS